MTEPVIVINGVTLTSGESMTVRVAVTSMLASLQDPEEREALGPIASAYEAQLREVLNLMLAGKP